MPDSSLGLSDASARCPACGEQCTHFEATYWEFGGQSRHGRALATCPNGHHILPLDEAIAAGLVPDGY